ncbi:MltA domain-containing protein [Aquincola sp. MAHUQ-54]|uniref:peptidoglycan lytic exotransglycosylase n=1 Tax=Aquincola agrisoli TaxID=3119538 RepID=A0AAW9QGL9_9BURK
MLRAYRTMRRGLAAGVCAVLAACSTPPLQEPAGSVPPPPPGERLPAGVVERAGARWIPAAWTDLPDWEADRTAEAWAAFVRGCERPAPGWSRLCAEALLAAPVPDDTAVRAWFVQRLQPYRVEPLDRPEPEGLITGYFEPLVEASRQPRGGFRIPLHMSPADLAQRKPYWTRQQIDTLPVAQAALRGREIAYVADPLDALVLQIQGSGRLRITEPDGRQQVVRVAFAGHNDQPYKSVGRWLIDQGELRADAASWPAIREWARRNPRRVNEMLWSNPRTVFFREEPLPDPTAGPRGAQGVPLTPERSIAVDPRSVPYGTPVWLDTTEPLSSTPLRRLVMAQDTGSAIVGAVRADYFWGPGEMAEQQAGRMKQRLRMWVLAPR